MIEGLIFDLGNTLMYLAADGQEVRQQGIKLLVAYLETHQLYLDPTFEADFISQRKRGRELAARTDVEYTATEALQETLARHGHREVAQNILAGAIEMYFRPEQAHWETCPGAAETLRALRERGLRVGLISNATDHPLIERIVAQGGLSPFLDPIVSSAAMPWRKPDARIFQHVLDLWGQSPEQVVMVGDWRETDILGAHRAGMRAVLIDQQLPEEPHLPTDPPDGHLLGADATVSELGEVIEVIERFQ